MRLAEEVLAGLGYEPVGCTGTAEALRVFSAAPERFDAVISDAIMPEMPGIELLAHMRRLRPDIPALLVSGYGGPDLQSQAAAGGVTILNKPLHATELAAALATALAARRTDSKARRPLQASESGRARS